MDKQLIQEQIEELLKELEKTPPRERAERLRMLATFGFVRQG